MLEAASRSVPLLVEGVKTNFYGLGYPAYCTQPTLSAILLAFVLGGLYNWIFCLPPSPLDFLDFPSGLIF